MKKIRVLNVVFGAHIESWEIPAFRSAVIEKVGRENVLFHNHLHGDKFLYKYPLIQYKQINKKPALYCIDFGVDEIHKFFEKKDWNIRLSGRRLEMTIDKLQMNQFTMQVWDKMFRYNIRNWIALNQDNHKKYRETEGLADRIVMLESILKANILSFAKGIEWTVDKQVEIRISELNEPRPVKLKGETVLGFNLEFNTNVFLPNYIGLGKSVSLGYGVVTQKRERN